MGAPLWHWGRLPNKRNAKRRMVMTDERNRLGGASRLFAGLLAVAAVALAAGESSAAEANFYSGKQIPLIVPSGPTGAYTAYSRLLSRHWPKHIPGSPGFVIQNMPGGGGITAANHMANRAPRDGLTVAIFFASAPSAPLVSPDTALFDANT